MAEACGVCPRTTCCNAPSSDPTNSTRVRRRVSRQASLGVRVILRRNKGGAGALVTVKLGYTLEAQLSSPDGPINIEGVPQPQLGPLFEVQT